MNSEIRKGDTRNGCVRNGGVIRQLIGVANRRTARTKRMIVLCFAVVGFEKSVAPLKSWLVLLVVAQEGFACRPDVLIIKI